MSDVLDRATFEKAYAGKAPWDIGKPQAPFVAVADRVTGPVLDSGCGTGDTALFFAARGLRVTGIDLVDEAIRRAPGQGGRAASDGRVPCQGRADLGRLGRAIRQRGRQRPVPRLHRRRPTAVRSVVGTPD